MIHALALVAFLNGPVAIEPPKAGLIEVRKVWDRGGHNAFTDLIWHDGRWSLAFREGSTHVAPDGALRVLTSTDGRTWESAALIRSDSADLRDPKLSAMPDGRLLLLAAAAPRIPGRGRHQSMAWTSRDGREWGQGVPIGEPGIWIWRAAWSGPTALAVGYATDGPKLARLYETADGKDFRTLVPTLSDAGYPNEAALAFLPGGECLCLLRRDGKGQNTGLLGRSMPPYRDWTWNDLGVQIGGPNLVRLPDGRLVAGVRLHDKKVRTSLCMLDPKTNRLNEFLALPSGGDSSYPGLVWREGELWVSYYSSHEGKTSIYLARVVPPTE